eukprot:INCI7077.3.p1 GENE.INCI7077.3~~INCI7077.3.p1  ORF type:complete len:931 (+),score=162.20 INCI7077.3:195-2987(+)
MVASRAACCLLLLQLLSALALLCRFTSAVSAVSPTAAAARHRSSSRDAPEAPVYELLERLLPGSSPAFDLKIGPCSSSSRGSSNVGSSVGSAAKKQAKDEGGNSNSDEVKCFSVRDASGSLSTRSRSSGKAGASIAVTASGVNELSAGLGVYLREVCNMTIGWERGGGSNVAVPETWPAVGPTPITRSRNTPFSYMMNVCTHSYSLVWYDWAHWETFIDWMALSGLNLVLAMTGQEEVQYKVFQKLGLNDTTIRTWFNGPAFLTWSRGQNEYGNNIAGPLPRSFMQAQWNLQRQILSRYRELGIIGQLPAFQGNVPIALKEVYSDANITQQGDTGWMDSLDPLYGKIADLWMQTLIADFGTDHWYQLDGYFNGGTAPWDATDPGVSWKDEISATAPACEYGAKTDGYIAGCAADHCKHYTSLLEAQTACSADMSCGGITLTSQGGPSEGYETRAGNSVAPSPIGEASWLIVNVVECHPPVPIEPDFMSHRRGVAAYTGLNRTDPDAIWSFQGWAFIGWTSRQQGSFIKGFVDAAPPGKFVVIDMSTDGDGEWKKWDNAAFFDAHFIWTTLHDFGGTDAIKGRLTHINDIPFAAQKSAGGVDTNVWGTGFTPEGIDQNPVYYEFMLGMNWRTAPEPNITAHVIGRSFRRYGLVEYDDAVAQSWALLVESGYNQDLSVQDNTAVPHLRGTTQFEADRITPTPTLCQIFDAWELLVSAAPTVARANGLESSALHEPFRYDLVNLGRELLAQLTVPMVLNFTDATGAGTIDASTVNATGTLYIELLRDIDELVATDTAFMLGPWIAMARSLAAPGDDDCGDKDCPAFYEWNARVQLTTWNPTTKDDIKIPGGPIDYAGKHWSGLIRDYYAVRAQLLLQQATLDASKGQKLDQAAVDLAFAQHAYNWTNSENKSACNCVLMGIAAVSVSIWGGGL